jgi:inhibitor of cysteine peptidase
VLTEQDSDREVGVQVGDEVLVTLDENPSTGYSWALTSVIQGALELETSSFSAGEGAVGGGGRRSFLFRVTGPGATALELQLRRPWERSTAPAARLRLLVHARRS